MTRFLTATALSLSLAGGVVVLAQTNQHSGRKGMMGESASCPMHEQMMGKMSDEQKEKMQGMMSQMNMDEGMMMRCKAMMHADISAHDPDTLLTLSDDLQLSREQQDQLKEISQRAEAEARQLLTEDQRAQAETLGEKPANMCTMMGMMMERMEGEDMGMMCPMMSMMSHGEKASTKAPEKTTTN